jgi:tetratricopeptide (TPR) repeat protein
MDKSAPSRQSPAAAHGRVVELSKQGHLLFKKKHYDEARALFEEALALEPNNPYILTGLGDTLRTLKSYPRSARCYQEVLDKDPNNLFALRGLGDTYRGQQLMDKALILWERYILFRPRDIFVVTRIADGHKTLGNYDQAEARYRQALGINKDDRYALMGLADLYHKIGQDKLAISHYEQVLAKGPLMINILTIVANLYWHRGELERAREYFEKALKIESHNSYALYGLGNYYRWHRDHATAITLWERILERDFGTINMLTRLADAYRNTGNLVAAEKTYRANLETGYDKFSMLGLGKLHAMRGEGEHALRCYQTLVAREGDHGWFFQEIAKLLVEHGWMPEATAFYRSACELQQPTPALKHKLTELAEQLQLILD